ncbi:MAG TPA: PorV/PorQ family protein, partial [Bacteroidia bacterium]|nr:PorV/PorQ family protein [Bacteroidia bacterium]
LGLMSMDFGEIEITTNDLPEGGIGTFSPQFLNITAAYSKKFSNSIYGGIALKIVDESISNLNAGGVAFDAGIQYVTGTSTGKDNIKFGIALKNVGPPLSFGGDGLSFKGSVPGGTNLITVEQRVEKFEMPSLINIGLTYDYKLSEMHRISLAGTFTANSFSNDQINMGLEYAFKENFMLRGGYAYETDIDDADLKRTANDGLSAGASVEVPLGKSGKNLGFDYSYTFTTPFDGTHRMGVKISL